MRHVHRGTVPVCTRVMILVDAFCKAVEGTELRKNYQNYQKNYRMHPILLGVHSFCLYFCSVLDDNDNENKNEKSGDAEGA